MLAHPKKVPVKAYTFIDFIDYSRFQQTFPHLCTCWVCFAIKCELDCVLKKGNEIFHNLLKPHKAI